MIIISLVLLIVGMPVLPFTDNLTQNHLLHAADTDINTTTGTFRVRIHIIDENNESYLSEVDDIIYRRMLGRDIKQLAVSLLRDPDGTPSGFVGCVKYDYEKLDITELKECGLELEQIYATNDKMVMKNLNKLN